jgi:ATP-dependent DNA helicase
MGGSAKPSEARQTITEMAAELLALEGEHIEVVQNTAAGKRGVISDAELDALLDRRKEVFEGRGVGWKSGVSVVKSGGGGGVVGDRAPAATTTTPGNVDSSGLFEVYEVPKDEGNDALAHMLGEEVVA